MKTAIRPLPSTLARKASLLPLLALPLLTGCTAIGLAGTEALVVGGAVGATAVVVAGQEASSRIRVYGNYADEQGYWFNRELYNVWVVSDSPEDSERVARATATDSCERKGKSPTVGKTRAWREWPPFAPIFEKRYSFEMRFRCDNQPDDPQ